MPEQDLPPKPERIEIQGPEDVALKQLIPEDAQTYFDLIDADREHFKYGEETTPNKYPTVESVRESIDDPSNSERLRFGIWDKDTMVGSINLTPKRPGVAEIGYWVGGQHKGHGYARRATELLIGYAFNDLRLNSLMAWVAPENKASVKTLERVGFRKDTESGPQILYQLTRSDLTP